MAEFELSPASLIDALYESVSQRIVQGQIAPGEKLTELRLATEYKVARPTAKACLERLTIAGLLRRSAHKTAVVPVLGPSDIEDLHLGRRAVECAAVSALAASGVVPTKAAEAHHAYDAAVGVADYRKRVAADVAFHAALVAGTGSERLRRMHELLIGEVHLTMGLFPAHRAALGDDIVAEHGRILDAIQACDGSEAEAAVTAHLEAARDRLLAHLVETSHPA